MPEMRGEIAQAYFRYGRGALRTWTYLRETRPRALIPPALWLCASAIGFLGGVPGLGYFALGIFVGWLTAVIGNARHIVRCWPAIASLLDWEEVERATESQIGGNTD
jgi:hypothetical protein